MGPSFTFNGHVASKFGVDEAIMIHHFQFWISQNKRLKRNFIENRTWTYQTLEEIAACFSFWSIDQVKRILKKLVYKYKVLSKNNFNKNAYDRTVWYAFVDESLFIEDFIDIERNRQMKKVESPNEKSGIAPPIPDNKTDNKTDIYKESKPKKEETGAIAPLASNDAHVSVQFSIEVNEILELLKKSLRILKSDYKITLSQENNWKADIDKMIRIDKCNPLEIKDLLTWLPTNNFWPKNIKSGQKLRQHYQTLIIEKNKDQKLKYGERYKCFAGKIKKVAKAYNLNINDSGVYDPTVHLELTFSMPYEDFCRSIAKAYRITDFERDM